jgi:hypothetical protein
MNKPSFKTCPAGHFYAASQTQCPICSEPKKNPAVSDDKTEILPQTSVFNNEDADKTIIEHLPSAGAPLADTDDRTIIIRKKEHSGDADKQPVLSRKLTGWLVSFTLDEMGVDFRLFEGQNKIGRDPSSTVCLLQDPSVSGHHATILFRNNACYLRDELASNSSYINEVELAPGSTMEVKDGDMLRFGNHLYLFRSAIR